MEHQLFILSYVQSLWQLLHTLPSNLLYQWNLSPHRPSPSAEDGACTRHRHPFFDSGTELTGTGVNGAFCQNNLRKTICESHLKWKVFLFLSQQSSLIHRSIPRRVWKTNLQLWIFNTFYYKKYVIYQISVELCWKVKPFTYDDGR